MHSRATTLVDTRAHGTRMHIRERACMYTRTFISEWRPVRSSGVDATRRDSPIVAQNGRVADLN